MTRRVNAVLTALKGMVENGQVTVADVVANADENVSDRTATRALDDLASGDLATIERDGNTKVARPGSLAGEYLLLDRSNADVRDYAPADAGPSDSLDAIAQSVGDAGGSADDETDASADVGDPAPDQERVDALADATGLDGFGHAEHLLETIAALDVPGQGETADDRRALMVDVVEYMNADGGTVAPKDLKNHVVEPNLEKAGYSSVRSAWKNLVYPALVDLDDATNPGGEGSHGWRWDGE